MILSLAEERKLETDICSSHINIFNEGENKTKIKYEMSNKNKMLEKLAGHALKGGFLLVSGAIGEALGSTVGSGLKMKLFPEFRDAELASAERSIEEANYLRDENERRKNAAKKKKKPKEESK